MQFLVGAQLLPGFARLLSAMGHEAEHVSDAGMRSASDGDIWAYALTHSAVIVTKDQDFALRRAVVRTGPPVVWVRVPNTRRQKLLVWFGSVAPQRVAALERGETLVEVA